MAATGGLGTGRGRWEVERSAGMEFGSWSLCQQRSTADERRTATDLSYYDWKTTTDDSVVCDGTMEWNVLAVVVAFVAELDYA